MSIEIRNITKSFGGFTALNNVSLTVPTGELVALLGPSGSGKTTLLRVIAGLEIPDNGEIIFNGDSSAERNIRDQQVGFVFQHYALFKHMTVFENVAFGLRVRSKKERPSKEEINNKVHELLKLVQLEGAANRYPSQLSGGQRQRIALARALAVEPKVLLLDEPFGALDAKVRQELRRWLRRLHDELHVTSVFVTHDQEEALEVADRLVVMNEGKIEQVGTPEEVYNSPSTPFVYQFIGNVNIFHGRINQGLAKLGDIEFETPDHINTHNAAAVGYARPSDIHIERFNGSSENIKANITHISQYGPLIRLELKRTDTDELIEAEISREKFFEYKFKKGEIVSISVKNLKVFLEDYTI